MTSISKYCLGFIFLVLFSCRHGVYNPTAAITKASTLSDADLDFLLKASTGSMLKEELGKTARDKAAHTKVKDFGEWMIKDNSTGERLLQSLAASKGIILPESISESAQMERNYFQFKEDDEFDLCYINRMITDHKNDISDFEKEARDGLDTDVKSFAQNSLKLLHRHLSGAQEIWKEMQTP